MPAQLIVGPSEHGVVGYARALAAETGAPVTDGADLPAITGGSRLHLHFTDRLFGRDPASAAQRIADLTGTASYAVTLHDIPQPSDGEANLQRRAAAYRMVLRSARGVVCNSRHEAELLRTHVDTDAEPTIIPLPVDARAGHPAATAIVPVVALVGFVYPGKGHREAIDALAGVLARPRAGAGADRLPRTVVALGRASPGHERDVNALRAHAELRGVGFEVTGYLTEDELLARCRSAAVPLSAHQHISASGSINSWLHAGRRPIVLDGRYAREMDALRPGTLTLVPAAELATAIEQASLHLDGTMLATTTSLRPTVDDTARAYVDWWRGLTW